MAVPLVVLPFLPIALGSTTTAAASLLTKLAIAIGGSAIVSSALLADYFTKNPDEVFDKFKKETYVKAREGQEIDEEYFPMLIALLANREYIINFNDIPFDDRDPLLRYGQVNLGAPEYSLTDAEQGVIVNQIIEQGDIRLIQSDLLLYQLIADNYMLVNFIDDVTVKTRKLLKETPIRQIDDLKPVEKLLVEVLEGVQLGASEEIREARIILAANDASGLDEVSLPVATFKEEVQKIGQSLASVENFNALIVDIDEQKFVKEVIRERFRLFIQDQIDQDLSNRDLSELTRSLDVVFQVRTAQVANLIYEALLRQSEDLRRVELIREGLADTDPPENPLLSGNVEQAENRAVNSLLDIADNVPPEEELTEEQKDANLAIVSQCALLLNINTLKQANRDDILENIDDDYHNGIPYDGRFVMVENPENNLSAINKMLANKDLSSLFELENKEVSQLVPKVRLFKISQDGTNETEFVFSQTEDVDRKRNFKTKGPTFFSSDFDKGSGAGVKEFSFNFNGTTPATSRNDVECTLTLFFQTFNDFIRTRKDYNNNEYRFVDLVIQPPADTKSKTKGFLSRLEYRPEFYKIRAEVGYYIPDNFPVDKRDAIMKSNASLVLTMVDHDININNDGTVEINLSYRAYIESALKSYRYDALATPEITSRRIQRAEQYLEILSRDACTQEELNQIKRAYEAEEEQLTRLSLRSIFRRLINNGKVHTLNINSVDRNRFIRNGSFEGIPRLTNLQNQIIQEAPQASDALDTLEEVSLGFVNNLLEAEPGSSIDTFDRTDEINFFYLGDLLYVILENINTDIPGLQQLGNTKIILSSLDIPSYRSNGQPTSINIADIPVSVDYFYEWYTDQVLAKGQTRRTFPILVFIRELCNRLITPALLENCYNRNLEKKLRFQSSSITIYDPEDKLNQEIEARVDSGKLAINLSNSQNIPFYSMDYSGVDVGDPNSFSPDPSEMSTLLIIYPVGKPARHEGTGKYLQDIDRGCFHIDIGRNKGIVKTVNFNKTDMQYVREARFVQQNGISDIMQLSAVYKTTVEMVGNTIFYPGMELYINPFGVGGTDFGSPTDTQSIANKLGFGGYHTIISVNSRITPGSFSTSVVAQQYYSGDGRTRAAQAGEHITPTDVNIEAAPANRDQTFCNVAIQAAEGDLARLVSGADSPATSIEKIDETARNRDAEQSQPLAEVRTVEETRAAIAEGNQIDLDTLSADQAIDFDFQPSEVVPEQADAESELPTSSASTNSEPSIPPAPEVEAEPEEPESQPLSMDTIEQESIVLTYRTPSEMQLINLRQELEKTNRAKVDSLEIQSRPNEFLVYSISSSKEFAMFWLMKTLDSVLGEEQMVVYPRDGGGETYIELSENGNFFLVATILTREVVPNA